MIKLYTPDGREIVGTLETVKGCACIDGLDDDGQPIYSGETKIYWDEQGTVVRNGQRIFVDVTGEEWAEWLLVRKEVADISGYKVHHDVMGWYVVAPNEEEPESGYSLGFDGRIHYLTEADAWEIVAHRAAYEKGEDENDGE